MSPRGDGPLTRQIRAQSHGVERPKLKQTTSKSCQTHRPNQEAHKKTPTKIGLNWSSFGANDPPLAPFVLNFLVGGLPPPLQHQWNRYSWRNWSEEWQFVQDRKESREYTMGHSLSSTYKREATPPHYTQHTKDQELLHL
jgi:hypothetical protein